MQLVIAIPAIFVLVVIDQLLKNWAITWLATHHDISLISGVLYLSYVGNKGAAFGILTNQRWIFISISFLVCVLGLIYLFLKKSKINLESWAIILIIAGGIGNLIDRVSSGTVVDYIDVPFFAVFNFADSCVCVGAVLFCIYFLFLAPKKINEIPNDISEDGNTIENPHQD